VPRDGTKRNIPTLATPGDPQSTRDPYGRQIPSRGNEHRAYPPPMESLGRVKPPRKSGEPGKGFSTFPGVRFTLAWEILPVSKTICIRTTGAGNNVYPIIISIQDNYNTF
jgi:hypothetical protein